MMEPLPITVPKPGDWVVWRSRKSARLAIAYIVQSPVGTDPVLYDMPANHFAAYYRNNDEEWEGPYALFTGYIYSIIPKPLLIEVESFR